MTEFKVGYTYEIRAYVVFEAENEQLAHEAIMNKLDEGIEEIDSMDNNIVHRNFTVTDVEEI